MIISLIEKHSHKRNLLIGIVFIVLINTVVFPLFPKFFSNTSFTAEHFLDLRFGFSPAIVHDVLYAMQDQGRFIYLLSTLFIDIPYALIYGFVYSFLIVFFYKKINKNDARYLMFIPFLISLFDLIENGGIIYFINKFPHINPDIVKIISISNQIKWISAIITFLVILLLLLAVIANHYSKKNQ